MEPQVINYPYSDGKLGVAHGYLLPSVVETLQALGRSERRVFELGCGNGSVASRLTELGYEVTGIDASAEAIAQAHRHYPSLGLSLGSAYDDLAARYGTFPIVISLEVIEHLYAPRTFAANVFRLLEPGGTAIISTPYHGYLKNLALALTGTLDAHFTALWDHGHIKFWSMKTLRILLQETGFISISFKRVGRTPALAKSMLAVATKG